VEAGSELIVEAGARVLAPEGGAIIVRGSLRVAGSAGRKAFFGQAAAGGPWGGIRIEPGGSAEVVHADFEGEGAAAAAAERPALIAAERAAIVVRSSSFHAIPAPAIEVVEGSAEVADCEFISTMEAIHGVRSTVIAARNLVERTLGDSDGIDLDEDPLPGRPGSRIEENTILRAGDDGIDLLRSSALVRGNVIVSAEDRGISVEGEGSPVIEGNIVASCRDGIALKDGTAASGHHNTVTGSIAGLRAFRKEPGAPGARGTFHSSIFWGNGLDAAVESGSTLALDHSDVGIDPAGWGEANFSADPLFAGRDDLRLLAGSPCTAAGRDGSPAGARGLADGGPPEISSVEPASGPARGGNRMTIAGRALDGALAARIGGRPLAGAVALAAGGIRGTVPPAARSGACSVEVETAGGTARLAGGYRYALRLLKGDADGDLRLSVADAIAVLRGLFAGGGLPECPAALDLTGDARADIADALVLLEYLFAGGPPPDTIFIDCD
jgi:parallel beta-helix repeat protein